jgi:hypothetical protein
MVDRYYNPFQAVDIHVPEKYRGFFTQYCKTSGKSSYNLSPFPRMVDLWFFSICVAMHMGLEPVNIGSIETYKVIDGSIFGSDPVRIHLLMLIAIERSDSIDVISEPRKMMNIANELSVAGLEQVEEMLKNGDSEPIWNLSESINDMFQAS